MMAMASKGILERISKPDPPEEMQKWIGSMRVVGETQDAILADRRMSMRRVKQLCRDLADSHPQAAEFLGKVRAEAEGALRKKPSAAADKGDGK